MGDFDGRVAIVTGVGRQAGIGAAIARRLAAGGAHLVLADLCAPPSDLPHPGSGQWEELAAVAAEVEAMGVRALPLRVDVAEASLVRAMAEQARAAFGRVDILVNNAGAAIGPGPVLHMAEEAWRRTLDINATGTFLCCQAIVPLIIAGGRGGRVINVSSIAAERPKPFVSAYAASKAAVLALTRSLAQEVAAFGVTVNAVLPGDVDTPMKQWQLQLESAVRGIPYEQGLAAAVGRIPLGRLATPDDVAHVVAFLASDAAAFVTGEGIRITGGREWT
jgi:meso-butanediol dehydrogenase/(S,S)-butanediol dehydrogenase/diacetyl reductase